MTVAAIVAASLPAGAAVLVFGTLYGAGAGPLLGGPLTVLSSIVIFSGALQFALASLLSAGASTPALLLMATTLNLRHLVLGAVLRPRVGESRWRRAALAFFLVDESFGFAVAAGDTARREGRPAQAATERTLLVSGLVCYTAWLLGTVIGLLGAGLPGMKDVAGAIFPVLFIGLAALAMTGRRSAIRAGAAAVLTAAVALALPDLRAMAPVLAGVIVALPGDDE